MNDHKGELDRYLYGLPDEDIFAGSKKLQMRIEHIENSLKFRQNKNVIKELIIYHNEVNNDIYNLSARILSNFWDSYAELNEFREMEFRYTNDEQKWQEIWDSDFDIYLFIFANFLSHIKTNCAISAYRIIFNSLSEDVIYLKNRYVGREFDGSIREKTKDGKILFKEAQERYKIYFDEMQDLRSVINSFYEQGGIRTQIRIFGRHICSRFHLAIPDSIYSGGRTKKLIYDLSQLNSHAEKSLSRRRIG